MFKLNAIRLLAVAAFCVASVPASADDLDIQPGALQADFDDIAEDLSAAIAYKSVQPAAPQGLIGFDVGAIASYTGVENEGAWRRVTGQSVSELGFIGLAASKGLPFNFDVAAYYTVIPGTDAKLYGAEARYAVLDGNIALPSIALRLGYSELTGEDDLEADALSYDISISKTFPILTPYIGYGRVDGTVTPKGTAATTLDAEDHDLDRVFLGAKISLAIMSIGLETEQTGDNTGFNLRIAFGL